MLVSALRTLRRAAKDADLVHVYWLMALAARAPLRPAVGAHAPGQRNRRRLPRPRPAEARGVAPEADPPPRRSSHLRFAGADEGCREARRERGVHPERNRPAGPRSAKRRRRPRSSTRAGWSRRRESANWRRPPTTSTSSSRATARFGISSPSRSASFRTTSSKSCTSARRSSSIPSYQEGLSVVCLEAMAHGRPVVGSDIPGVAELVVPDETGLLVPPRDAGRSARGVAGTARRPDAAAPDGARWT